jgi:predicted PurR-regulated permease PerM
MTLPLPPSSTPTKLAARSSRPDAAKVMIVFVLIVVTLYFGREVLIPVVLALLLTFLLAPPVSWFRKIYLGRVPSVVLVVTLALGVLIAIGGVIGSQLRELATDLPHYASTIEAKVTIVKQETLGRLSHVMNMAEAPHKAGPSAPRPSTPVASHQGANQPEHSAQSEIFPTTPTAPQSMPTPWQLVQQYISPLMSPLATIGIVFVVAVFGLLQREDLRDRLIRLIGPDDIHRTTVAMDDAGRRLARYFLTQLSINTVFGVVIGIGLYFIGVPKPILWGVLSTVLRFIPYIGSFISALLPIALAAAVQPGWSMMLWTAAFFLIAEGVTGQALEPLIYGQSSGLSPFSVIVAAIFWSWVWGPVGLFLSTPLTLCLAVMGRHVKGLEFLDIALGDRPPLTPTESFYQRILADDADEVLAHAELILKDMPLARYYDEVALPGMQLAANDAELGALTDEQQENVKVTIYELVQGLSEYQGEKRMVSLKGPTVNDHGDHTPERPNEAGDETRSKFEIDAAWHKQSTVLSIAGRGPLDEPAASMLVQLLEQCDIGSKLIKYKDVSRYSVENLDTTNVAMVCIAFLNIYGNPAHLRYLVQRLRKRLPEGTSILVGLWAVDDATINVEETRASIGADYFASSFEQVLKFCQTVIESSVEREVPLR